MKHKLLLVQAAFIAALAPASPAVAGPDDPSHMVPAVDSGRVVTWADLDGGAAGPMTVWVWLPPSYNVAKGRRYPVLYMHDGQNLFDPKLAKYDGSWDMDKAIPRIARQGDLREWIVVGVQHPRNRYSGLFAQKLLPLLSPDFQARVKKLQAGADQTDQFTGDAYLDFLVHKVKRRVDHNFRTLAGPQDTAVMGSSMGGLMSLYAIAEYPEIFGQAACVSAHLALADPSEDNTNHQRWAKEAAAAFKTYLSHSRMTPDRNHIYIDHGTDTEDAGYTPYATAVVSVLHALGWKDGPDFEYRTFAGAKHSEKAWSERVDIPLAFLDRKDP